MNITRLLDNMLKRKGITKFSTKDNHRIIEIDIVLEDEFIEPKGIVNNFNNCTFVINNDNYDDMDICICNSNINCDYEEDDFVKSTRFKMFF